MANWYGTTRTNYFKVYDEEKYIKLFNDLEVYDDTHIHDFSETKEGVLYHGFGAYDQINYVPAFDKHGHEKGSEDYDYADYSFMDWLKKLSRILTDDSVFVLQTVGNEKLRYLTACMYIVKPNKTPQFFSLDSILKKQLKIFYNNDIPDHAFCCY